MDNTIISSHFKVLKDKYPEINATQLGLVCLLLGSLRASMGHEGAKGTVLSYIHPKHLTKEVRDCLDFLEREVLSLKKSKIDIDYWKFGNKGEFRRNVDLPEVNNNELGTFN